MRDSLHFASDKVPSILRPMSTTIASGPTETIAPPFRLALEIREQFSEFGVFFWMKSTHDGGTNHLILS